MSNVPTRAGLGLAALLAAAAVMVCVLVTRDWLRTRPSSNLCRMWCRQVEGAREHLALGRGLPDGTDVKWSDLYPYLRDGAGGCPKGGRITPGAIGTPCSCSIHGPLGGGYALFPPDPPRAEGGTATMPVAPDVE